MDFEAAADLIRACADRLTDDQKLFVYGLFKQAREGDAPAEGPAAALVVQRAKWDAWNARRGLARDAAAHEYARVASIFRAELGGEAPR